MSINFSCPKCTTSFDVHEDTIDDLYKHINECCRQLNCTKCEGETYTTGSGLIDHYGKHSDNNVTYKKPCPLCGKAGVNHPGVMPGKKGKHLGRSMSMLPHVGDRVIALCNESKWQYFSASICR